MCCGTFFPFSLASQVFTYTEESESMASFFPHLTSTDVAPTSRAILSVYRNAFSEQLSSGTIRPTVLPYQLYTTFILIVYLSLPHKKYPVIYASRWLVLALVNWLQWETLWKTSSSSYCIGYAVGLSISWMIVWSWALLVFMKPQWDAKRVQRIKIQMNDAQSAAISIPDLPKIKKDEGNLRQRKYIYGDLHIQDRAVVKTNSSQTCYKYFWQPYPDTLFERLAWATDLVFNYRGPGWNWAISPLPSLPPDILKQLGEPVPVESYSSVSSVGLRRFNTRSELCRSRLPRLVFGYFLLDFLKVIMMSDPYFKFGPTTYALPAHLRHLSPFAIHMYRQSLSSGTIIAGIAIANYLPPLIISVICGSKIFGLRAEAWYYPSMWGPFSNLCYKGLGGLWGNYWHQIFRQGFTAPTNYLLRNGYMKAKSPMAMLVGLGFAFGISGFVHWAGSVTIYAKTYPSHLILFFALQGIGILIQSTFCTIFASSLKALPKSVRYTSNLAYSLFWLYSTGWILADDFARGGLWLWEPVPFSPLRGLGFGEPDAGWWCWEHLGIGWYSGKHFWESGIAL